LRLFSLSGAVLAPLLFVLLTACAGQPKSASADHAWVENSHIASTAPEKTAQEKGQPETMDKEGKTVNAVLPEDVLDKKDLDKPPPKYEDWHKEGSGSGGKETSDTTAGAIPAVKPFNLGRDPGGPDDKTLYLIVPSLGLTDVLVYNSVKEEKLKKSVVHIPATGFPWQKGRTPTSPAIVSGTRGQAFTSPSTTSTSSSRERRSCSRTKQGRPTSTA